MIDAKAIILAGGQGVRFWPVSRAKKPKQFLALGASKDSLIQATARRIEPLVGRDNIFFVTCEILRDAVREHVPHSRIVCEPMARNTAASIGLGAVCARNGGGDPVMIVLPADHAVKDEGLLRATLQEAVELAAASELLVTVGIPPACPHTGYGYIRRGQPLGGKTFIVKRFFEKPNLERAMRYCESGDYFWNSGMFIWRTSIVLKAIEQFLPSLYEGLVQIEGALGTAEESAVMRTVFESLDPISIDIGVLELARNCAMVEAHPFGWNDVGSWDAWAEHFRADESGNLLHGDTLAIESCDCIVHSEAGGGRKRLTALLGVENLVVIDAGDAILICPRDRVQDVRRVVDVLKQRGMEEFI